MSILLFIQADLEEFEQNVDYSTMYYFRQALCTSLSGNVCPLLTITSRCDDEETLEGSKQTNGCYCSSHIDPDCFLIVASSLSLCIMVHARRFWLGKSYIQVCVKEITQ